MLVLKILMYTNNRYIYYTNFLGRLGHDFAHPGVGPWPVSRRDQDDYGLIQVVDRSCNLSDIIGLKFIQYKVGITKTFNHSF